MRLRTDFAQYYDPLFDDDGPLFERMAFTRGGLQKRDQLALFERMGLRTPPHGIVRELAERSRMPFGGPAELWQREAQLVVYQDELLHQGRGKLRLSVEHALASYPDRYATLFVPTEHAAVNLRHVRIGRIGIWLRQVARGRDWRSNVDDDETVLARTEHPEAPPFPRVMWAIDFLPSHDGLLAIDFNTAPQLVTLGETGAVSAEEIHRELRAADPGHLRQPGDSL